MGVLIHTCSFYSTGLLFSSYSMLVWVTKTEPLGIIQARFYRPELPLILFFQFIKRKNSLELNDMVLTGQMQPLSPCQLSELGLHWISYPTPAPAEIWVYFHIRPRGHWIWGRGWPYFDTSALLSNLAWIQFFYKLGNFHLSRSSWSCGWDPYKKFTERNLVSAKSTPGAAL